MSGRAARWLVPWALLTCLSPTAPLASQEAEEPAGPLTAAQVVRLYASSVVLIQAELGDDQKKVGSGFAVSPGGVIATSLHVLDGARSASVRVDDKSFSVTGVRAFDIDRDLALLQVEGDGFVEVVPGDTSGLGRGDTIYVISNPLGLAGTVSKGLLAAWRQPSAETEDDLDAMAQLGGLAHGRLMQISAPVSPGSSGAPVFDEYGYVVGLVAAGFGAGALDLNFAVPIESLLPLLDRDEGWDFASLQTTLALRRQDLADPHLVDARFYLANEQLTEASKALDRALAVFPRSAEALTLKGLILLRGGQTDEAEELFRQAVASNPDSAEAWENLGNFLLVWKSERGRHEAVAAFNRALELDPWRAGAAFGLGLARIAQNRLDQARLMLQRAVEADRDHVRAWVHLGIVCLTLEDWSAAQEALESAHWLDGDDTQAVCGLAELYARARDSRAGDYRRRCEELSDSLP